MVITPPKWVVNICPVIVIIGFVWLVIGIIQKSVFIILGSVVTIMTAAGIYAEYKENDICRD